MREREIVEERQERNKGEEGEVDNRRGKEGREGQKHLVKKKWRTRGGEEDRIIARVTQSLLPPF
jgi:hypothetical protein